jgi:hypothetical protein
MSKPKACPECASEQLEPIMRKPMSSGLDPDPDPISGILAYRCSNGHIFLEMKDNA